MSLAGETKMDLADTKIFPFVRDDSTLCKLYPFEAGSTIAKSSDEDDSVWFIVKGVVELFAETHRDDGQNLHLEFLGEDYFLSGPLLHKLGFSQCRCVAFTPCELLRIPRATLDSAFEKDLALKCFYLEQLSLRACRLCRELIASKLFSQKQLLAAHFYMEADSAVCFFDVADACAAANTSKRHLYNLIRALEEDGIVTYKKPKTIFVNDEAALRRISQPVLDFYGNDV